MSSDPTLGIQLGAPWLHQTPKPRRFDITGALNECLEAAADWAVAHITELFLPSFPDGEPAAVELAHQRMQSATAVLHWENDRAAQAAAFAGAIYDDDTVAELLGGAQG